MTLWYRVLICIAVPFVFIYLWLRGRKAPAYRQHWRQRLALQSFPMQARDGILIHCVSVGETIAARGFIERILQQYPQLPITLTSMTPTARALAQQLFGERVFHAYLPLDTAGAMRRFFNKLVPRLVIILETELWPNLLRTADHQQIPVLVVNARLSERSAKSYQKYAWLIGPIWQHISWIAAQTEPSQQRFIHLGMPADKVAVRGNLKFDFQISEALQQQAQQWRTQLQRPVVVAASTHEGEDEQILDAFAQLLTQQPDCLLILVPRHPERFQTVTQLAQRQFKVVTRSSQQQVTAQHQVLVGDTMGELLLWYQVADVAFVGGSLIERGGHNPLEPVATSTAVVSGPHVFNFAEIFSRLEAVGAVKLVTHAEALAQAWQQLIAQPQLREQMVTAASAEFARDQGATAVMLTDVEAHLPPSTSLVRTLTMMQRLSPKPGLEYWYDAQALPDFNAEFFSADYWAQQNKVKGSATGRATAWFIEHGEQGMLLRHYYRGGLVGKLNKDRFKREPIETSRAMAEFSLLLKLRELGLPVPQPLAAKFERAPGWGYRADILVAIIPGAKDVFQRLQQASVTAPEWYRLGAAVKRLHQQQVYHSDLNCHNLMLDNAGKAWIVDFDKCEFRQPGEWQQANLERLLRSFNKEVKKAEEAGSVFHWQQARDWPLLLAGYQQDQEDPAVTETSA